MYAVSLFVDVMISLYRVYVTRVVGITSTLVLGHFGPRSFKLSK